MSIPEVNKNRRKRPAGELQKPWEREGHVPILRFDDDHPFGGVQGEGGVRLKSRIHPADRWVERMEPATSDLRASP
jgi:hypothetical protein